ncbi:NUDIX domain-containing protein [Pseudonocardia hispaniensis]|uniref:NUDIX domain-containing protein n=1 Tax=Pseudonocardia hispaniensis TaxID=904933 RepID=A0ABW1IYE6_9PSEU
MNWRDGSGRALADYRRPSVAVDVALLTVRADGLLAVLVHERDEEYATGRWSLPGVFVGEQELLADAALRALRDKVGVTGEKPRQLVVLDDPGRDDRGRVLSVAHVDLVPVARLPATAHLAPIRGERAVLPGGHTALAFDHDEIVARAVDWARDLYRERPDPRGLIGTEFTLRDLQRVHESVLGEPLQKDTFRRRMLGALQETDRLSSGTVGKPARLFRRVGPPPVGSVQPADGRKATSGSCSDVRRSQPTTSGTEV